MVSKDVLRQLEEAYPGIRITTDTQREHHERDVSLRFDGLLRSMLRQQFFAHYYFQVGLPQPLRSLSFKTSKDEVVAALKDIASDKLGGAFVFADAFGLKRANDEGGIAGGNKMLQNISDEITAAGFRLYGRLNIGDEIVGYHEGPPETVHAMCEGINVKLAEYLVAGLPTRLDFGIAEHHVVAETCLSLHEAGWEFDPALERSPGQHFYDVAQKIGEIRSKIMKRFELLMLIYVSLQLLHEEGSGHDLAMHNKLLATLLSRQNESLGLPDESWFKVPDVAMYARTHAVAHFVLPHDASLYDRIVHAYAERPFL
jgi:hypothetical protein